MTGKTFLTLDRVDALAKGEAEAFYYLYGFPWRKARTDWTKHTIRARGFPYGGICHKQPEFISHADLGIHIVLSFDKERNKDADDRKVTAPDLQGISGSGTWRVWRTRDRSPDLKVEDIRLVAITHTWQKKAKAVTGTRIGFFLGLIASRYPDLAGALAGKTIDPPWLNEETQDCSMD